MGWIRRALIVLFALAVAIATGVAVLPILALFDPVTREAGFMLAEFAALVVAGFEPDGDYAVESTDLAAFVWTALMAVGVVPVVFSALLGEIARVRSFLWYPIATGAIAACMPWLLRGALHTGKMTMASPEELRFAFVFFFSGLVSGAVYWLLANGGQSHLDDRPV
jgi:hypothetical protein